MVAEISCGPEMGLCFLKDEKGLCCVINAGDTEQSLRCQLASLSAVLSGLRYHFAGDNVLCTLYLFDRVVAIDVVVGTGSSIAASVPVEEFRAALLKLEAA